MQRHDGIRDELARAVIGHLATTLDAFDADPTIGQLRFRRQDVRGIGVLAAREPLWVFEEEQLVPAQPGGSLVNETLLERVGIAVVDATQPSSLHGRAAGRRRARARGRTE